jgi:hypothetical protein
MPLGPKIRAKRANQRYRHLKPFQFKKGQSGNPKGRPKGSRNRVNHELAMNQLVRIMESERSPAAVRVKAAKADFSHCVGAGADGRLGQRQQWLSGKAAQSGPKRRIPATAA